MMIQYTLLRYSGFFILYSQPSLSVFNIHICTNSSLLKAVQAFSIVFIKIVPASTGYLISEPLPYSQTFVAALHHFLHQNMYQFPIAVVTDYCKYNGLTMQILQQSQRSEFLYKSYKTKTELFLGLLLSASRSCPCSAETHISYSVGAAHVPCFPLCFCCHITSDYLCFLPLTHKDPCDYIGPTQIII